MVKKGPASSPGGQLQPEAMVAITLVEFSSGLTHLAGFHMLMDTWVGRLRLSPVSAKLAPSTLTQPPLLPVSMPACLYLSLQTIREVMD